MGAAHSCLGYGDSKRAKSGRSNIFFLLDLINQVAYYVLCIAELCDVLAVFWTRFTGIIYIGKQLKVVQCMSTPSFFWRATCVFIHFGWFIAFTLVKMFPTNQNRRKIKISCKFTTNNLKFVVYAENSYVESGGGNPGCFGYGDLFLIEAIYWENRPHFNCTVCNYVCWYYDFDIYDTSSPYTWFLGCTNFFLLFFYHWWWCILKCIASQ